MPPNRDRRKKWYKGGRRKAGTGGAESYLRPTLQPGLIARTGFGKSLIFHAFSILTGKITIQLVPLSKLGDEQLDDIRKLNGSNPCLITSKSRSADKALIAKIKDGMYTHVLLGPEQASSKSFRD